jgi:glutamate-1-semialdehyde 2,1-aminomutase
VELAEQMQRLIPSAEIMRFCLDGSEAVQTAFRVARAKTGRPKFLRFEGHYHGWLDNVSWGISASSEAALGSREAPVAQPWSAGLPPRTEDEFIILPWNDLPLVKATVAARHAEIAAIITEPVMCNNGCIPPVPGFLEGLREICNEYGIALIFDEVITGFRLSIGGAQQYFNVTPDLSVFAKAMASGYPISAIVGKREWMSQITEGRVVHAGTMNAGNPTIAAAQATLQVLEETLPYEHLFRYGQQLMNGLRAAAEKTGHSVLLSGPGPMFHIAFTDVAEVKDYRHTLSFNREKLAAFIAGMHDRGVRIIGRGLWYISAAHQEADIEKAIRTAEEVMQGL